MDEWIVIGGAAAVVVGLGVSGVLDRETIKEWLPKIKDWVKK